ncbi:MAG TPA: DUF5908 family protein [Chitinophagaceae bacterium]|nr:DUF5908 family protein [Chitinophagaceae bacterium]
MPVEIRELHIKATVGGKEPPPDCIKREDLDKLKKEIVKEVTEKILTKLRQKNER